MLDRAFRLTLRDYTTFFLVAATVFVPLHIVYSFLFQDVIAVSALHDQIARLAEGDTVRRVGSAELSTFRLAGWVLLVLEILVLPLLVGAAAAVMSRRDADELPRVSDALRSARSEISRFDSGRLRPGPTMVAAGVTVAIALLARGIGTALLVPLSDRTLWAGVALVEGVARSLGAPFVMVVAAFSLRATKAPRD